MTIKKHFLYIFLLLVFIPSVGYSLSDACTNPEEYTADKRCYVTDEEKQQNPYNAVVGFLYQNGTRKSCTGTIVKDENNEFFVYTAKHCSDLDIDGESDTNLRIRLQDGQEFDSVLVKQGNYGLRDDSGSFVGDWVKYKVSLDSNNKNLPYVREDIFKEGIINAQIVGYGRLKIMSDKEIDEVIEEYANWVEIFSNTEKDKTGKAKRNTQNGFREDGGLDGPNVMMFVQSHFNYTDTELKKTYCQYSSQGNTENCQGWGGNSGGPIFNGKGDIVGIVTRGNYNIGGSQHAGITFGTNLKFLEITEKGYNSNDIPQVSPGIELKSSGKLNHKQSKRRQHE